ncbi:MAG: hypothetical protein KGR26_11020 [Cyanobacteria bacterium REEB65]|nr:hypothetical protein [Cyanobacteria bacterium REEB65]
MQIAAAIDAKYEAGIQLYDKGAPLEEVLTHFEELRSEAPNDVRVAVSLSWLYILLGDKTKALACCREAKGTAQGKFNQVLAYLAFGEKGVRERFQEAVDFGGHEGIHDAMANLREAISRKGGSFPAAEKMLQWLESVHPHHD